MTAENSEQIDTTERQSFPHRVIKFLVLSIYTCHLEKLRKFGMEVIGEKNLQGLDGPAVYASNHVKLFLQSPLTFEIFAIPKVVQECTDRKTYIIGKSNPRLLIPRSIIIPAASWVYGCLSNIIPIDTKEPTRPTFEKVVTVMQEGSSVLIFPQGRVDKDFDSSKKYFGGAAFISIISGKPIIPVYIHTPPSWLVRNGVIKIAFGEPVPPEEMSNNKREKRKKLTIALQESMKQLHLENQPHT
jgi:1-acyl-sn-glycerol-3-phosphate acyltransferase